MFFEELQTLLDKHSSKDLFYIIKNNIPLKNYLITHTSFLPKEARIMERLYCFKHTITSLKLCPQCHLKPLRFKNFDVGYAHYCSVTCLNKSPEHINSIKQTNLKKYGTTTHLFNEENIAKRKEANLEKWGNEHNFASKEYREHLNTHFEEKYGNKNYTQTDAFKQSVYQKSIQILQKRLSYFDIEILDSENYNGLANGVYTQDKKERFSNRNFFSLKCKKCNHIYQNHLLDSFIPLCPQCHSNRESKPQLDLKNFLQSLNISFEENTRKIIKPLELDFYFKENNFAIELNGIYFHNLGMLSNKKMNETLFKDYELNCDVKNYHLLKNKMCEAKKIDLMQIYDVEWLNPMKKEILKSMIAYKLKQSSTKIDARKCELKIVEDKEILSEFLERNHIQGSVNSSINLGLYFKEELVSLMTFSKSRYTNDNSYELIRFCNKIYTNVRGAASKLLSYFQKEINTMGLPVVSYGDKRYANGNLYGTLGFKYVHTTKPNYKYFKNGKLYNRQLFQKKLIKHYQENKMYGIKHYEDTLTEQDLMILNGFDRIYEVGQMKFVL